MKEKRSLFIIHSNTFISQQKTSHLDHHQYYQHNLHLSINSMAVMLCPNFDALRDLHDCANDLLRSPVTQQALVHHRNEKWVDEVFEGSLKMLDLCGITRDVLLLVRQNLQDLESALRRSSVGDSSHHGNKFDGYCHFSVQKMKKEMFKCLEGLKGMMNKCDPSHLTDIDENLLVVITVLGEVRMTTISIVESILSFMAVSKPAPIRRSFFSKFMRGKRLRNASTEENGTMMFSENMSLYEVVGIQTASKRLEVLEDAIEGLEIELECMFKRLIQTRVSLLNILNH